MSLTEGATEDDSEKGFLLALAKRLFAGAADPSSSAGERARELESDIASCRVPMGKRGSSGFEELIPWGVRRT